MLSPATSFIGFWPKMVDPRRHPALQPFGRALGVHQPRVHAVARLPSIAVSPYSRFTHVVDFVTPATIGDPPMNYANNNNDGRPFRENTNFTACFLENLAGALVSVPASTVRRTDQGFIGYPRGTNRCLWNCDFPGGVSAGVWVSSGGGITATKDQTSGDGTLNAASRLTANGANARITHTAVTLASTNLLFQMRAKRLVGTGRIYMTLDNWATKTDVTALLGTTTWGLPFCSQDALANPQFGIEMETASDQIAVDFGDVWSTFITAQVSRKPQRIYARQTTVAASVAQSRPVAVAADAGFWNGVGGSLFLTPYAVYAECSSEGNAGQMAILTGITDTTITILPDGSVTFGQGSGSQASVPAGTFQFGLGINNKVLCQVDASGLKQITVNGVNGTDGTGGTFPATLSHMDIWTNGAAFRSLFGIGRKIAAVAAIMFSPADRITLTT